MKDLIVLVADSDIQQLMDTLMPKVMKVEGLLFSFDVKKHPGRDPGVYSKGPAFLRTFINEYHNAMLRMDYQCSITDHNHSLTAAEMEEHLENEMLQLGWVNANSDKSMQNRSCAIIIKPEVEKWLWVKEIHIKEVVGWKNTQVGPYPFLVNNGLKSASNPKPEDPKKALQALLFESKKPSSPSLFKEMAERASYKECEDRAFLKLVEQLREWYRII